MKMKKTIASIALAAIALVSFNSFAQNNDNTSDKAQCAGKEKCAKMKGNKGERRQCVDPFAGLTLNDTQKAQLSALKDKQRAAKAEMKQKKQKEDSAARAERRAARQQAKRQYLDEVKAIVGPDQYVIFLENFYLNADGGQHKAKMQANRHGKDGEKFDKGKMKGDRHGKDGKKFDKAQRPDGAKADKK